MFVFLTLTKLSSLASEFSHEDNDYLAHFVVLKNKRTPESETIKENAYMLYNFCI